MTPEEWAELERLCHKVLSEEPMPVTHTITEAVRLTGAFAASVQRHMREEV